MSDGLMVCHIYRVIYGEVFCLLFLGRYEFSIVL